MPLNDYICDGCQYMEEIYVKIHEVETYSVLCPNCEEHQLHITFRKAPAHRMGGDNSDRALNSMRRSLDERFVKKDIDDVRNKFGVLFDDSLRSAAAQRLKKREEGA